MVCNAVIDVLPATAWAEGAQLSAPPSSHRSGKKLWFQVSRQRGTSDDGDFLCGLGQGRTLALSVSLAPEETRLSGKESEYLFWSTFFSHAGSLLTLAILIGAH